jgi:cell division protein FtsB
MIEEIPAEPAAVERRPLRRPNAQEARDRRRRIATWALSVLLGVLLVNSLFGENGYLATIGAREELDRLRGEVAAQIEENTRLQSEAYRLQDDPAAVEEAARAMNYIRPGETLIIIRDGARSRTPSPAR